MPTAGTRPTALDVARRSGVSTATVSYVLNRTSGQTISPETRAKVLRAAKDLGYVQHAAAQALARGASRIVLIDLAGIPHGQLVEDGARRLAQAVRAKGYTPLLTPWGTGTSTQTLVELARAIAPHAVITVAPLAGRARKELAAAGVQAFGTLFSDARPLGELIEQAARAQVEFLAAQGHASVLYVPSSDAALAELSGRRGAAVASAAAEHGMAITALTTPERFDAFVDALASALSEAAPTAVAAYNDEVALRVLAGLQRLGVAVPSDVAVIGVDDLPLAELTTPPLTTVRYALDGPDPADAPLDWLDGTEPSTPAAPRGPIRHQLVRRASA